MEDVLWPLLSLHWCDLWGFGNIPLVVRLVSLRFRPPTVGCPQIANALMAHASLLLSGKKQWHSIQPPGPFSGSKACFHRIVTKGCHSKKCSDTQLSPCSTYPTVFTRQPSQLAIYGTCSLIVYILMLQLIVKYILITMYADDNEEGRLLAFKQFLHILPLAHATLCSFSWVDQISLV